MVATMPTAPSHRCLYKDSNRSAMRASSRDSIASMCASSRDSIASMRASTAWRSALRVVSRVWRSALVATVSVKAALIASVKASACCSVEARVLEVLRDFEGVKAGRGNHDLFLPEFTHDSYGPHQQGRPVLSGAEGGLWCGTRNGDARL